MQSPDFQPPSLAAAITYGEEVFSYVLDKAAQFPRLPDVAKPPNSWSDSLALIVQRDEEKRRKDAKKDKSKASRASIASIDGPVNTVPGGSIGHVPDQSVFWMFMEDYFRDLTTDDFHLLVPSVMKAADDESFTVPFMGREQSAKDKAARPYDRECKVEEAIGEGEGGGPSSSMLHPGSLHHASLVGPPKPCMETCSNSELRAVGSLMMKLGLLGDPTGLQLASGSFAGAGASGATQGGVHAPLTAQQGALTVEISTAERPQLESLLTRAAAEASAASCGERPTSSSAWANLAMHGLHLAGSAEDTETMLHSAFSAAGSASVAAPTTSPEDAAPNYFDGSTTGTGDYVHPLLRLLLARPPPAYVLDHRAHKLSSSGDQADDGGHDTIDLSSTPHAASMPAVTLPAGDVLTAGDLLATKRTLQPGSTPLPGIPPSPAAATSGAATPPAVPSCSAGGKDSDAEACKINQEVLQPQPSFSDLDVKAGSGLPGGDGQGLDQGAGSARGRTRSSINYSLLSGKKDKEKAAAAAVAAAAALAAAAAAAAAHNGAALGTPSAGKKKNPRGRPSLNKSGSGSGPGSASAATFAAASGLFSRCAAPGLGCCPTEEDLACYNPVVASVARCIAAGPHEQGLEAQWPLLESAADLLAVAPDDEIMAEILAVQAELAQQMGINRYQGSRFLLRALEDVPHQRAREEERLSEEADIQDYLMHKAEAKRIQKREMRELQKRQAAAALIVGPAAVAGQPSPLLLLSAADAFVLPAELAGELVDPLAVRGAEDEALCAICGDGTSEEPNHIVFCERCDVAVHQGCYGVSEIPQGEWLCWPCFYYEVEQRDKGVPQNEIRPPRWEMAAQGMAYAALPGGSSAVTCCLCPVKLGAFKQMTDTREWVHMVCGLWHAETSVLPGNVCEAVQSRAAVKTDRFGLPCAICQLTHGAVVRCSYGHCQSTFHPLCGRRAGQYIPVKLGPSGKVVYRSYCLQHSDMVKNKDAENNVVRGAIELLSKPKVAVPHRPRKDRNAQRDDDGDGGGGSEDAGEQADVTSPSLMLALEALAARELEAVTLQSVRYELEGLRLIADQVRRREKIKRQVAKSFEEEACMFARSFDTATATAPVAAAPSVVQLWGTGGVAAGPGEPAGLLDPPGEGHLLFPGELNAFPAAAAASIGTVPAKRAVRAAALAATAARVAAMDMDDLDDGASPHRATLGSPRARATAAATALRVEKVDAAAAATAAAAGAAKLTGSGRKIILRRPAGRPEAPDDAAGPSTAAVHTGPGMSTMSMISRSPTKRHSLGAAKTDDEEAAGLSAHTDLAPGPAPSTSGRSGRGRVRKPRVIPDAEMGDLSDPEAAYDPGVYASEEEGPGAALAPRSKRRSGGTAPAAAVGGAPPAKRQKQGAAGAGALAGSVRGTAAPPAPPAPRRHPRGVAASSGLLQQPSASEGVAEVALLVAESLGDEDADDVLMPNTGNMGSESMFQLPGGYLMDGMAMATGPSLIQVREHMVMSQEQAEMNNSQLPRGYKYVKSDMLPKNA